MKSLILICLSFLLLATKLKGQTFDFEKMNFQKPKNLEKVILIQDCNVCNPQSFRDTIQISFFNSNNQIIHTQHIDVSDKKINNLVDFAYDKRGNLLVMKIYGSWEIRTKYELGLSKDSLSLDFVKYRWDTTISRTEKYDYKGNKIIKKRFYSLNVLEYQEEYFYNANGTLAEQITTYSPVDSGLSFEANSTQIKRNSNNNNLVSRELYSYQNNIIICKYFKDNKVYNTKTIIKNKNNLVTKEQLVDESNMLINERVYQYNSKNQLEDIFINDTGRGNYDVALGNHLHYEYDENGNLINLITY